MEGRGRCTETNSSRSRTRLIVHKSTDTRTCCVCVLARVRGHEVTGGPRSQSEWKREVTQTGGGKIPRPRNHESSIVPLSAAPHPNLVAALCPERSVQTKPKTNSKIKHTKKKGTFSFRGHRCTHLPAWRGGEKITSRERARVGRPHSRGQGTPAALHICAHMYMGIYNVHV